MIVTILLLLRKIIELSRKLSACKKDLFFDLIHSSKSSFNESLNESSIIYWNCQNINIEDLKSFRQDTFKDFSFYDSIEQKDLQNKLNWLTSLKKMDYDEDGKKEVVIAGLKGNIISPVSDCNSNNLAMSKENIFLCSTESIQDFSNILQDNLEYQWILDCGYKDSNHQQGILSLLGSQDLVNYEDMSRNIDANLAEVDMDDFNREDIHSVLSSLPNIQGVEEREMFASVSKSMMVKFDLGSSISSHSKEEQMDSTSLCKSQLLFSPVHDNYFPNSNLSIDSLDLSENDINLMVTCQANKNNYTIAFEGSTVMASDDSESRETGSGGSTSFENEITHYQSELRKKQSCTQHFKTYCGDAMTHSDSTFTTWSKIKENSDDNLNLKRHPSGNNNTNIEADLASCEINNSSATKSLSLPNLFHQKIRRNSAKPGSESESVCSDSEQQCIKLYDIQNTCNSKSLDHSTLSASNKPPQNFSLVKLFIKQKSASHEGVSNYVFEHNLNPNDQEENNHLIKHSEASNCCLNGTNINLNDSSCNEILGFKKNVWNEEKVLSKINRSQITKSVIQNSVKEHRACCRKCSKISNKSCNFCNVSGEKYYSDESTQENGSNTESAENLTCHCTNIPSNFGSKKFMAEKSVQTSKFFEKNENNKNAQKNQTKVPVYILYPNYSLPNLEFLKKEHYVQNIDFLKIFLRPQKFKMGESPAASPKVSEKSFGKRPFSLNDIETLKKTGFKHVKDWESLTFLLPKEYKQFLQEIPEIVAQLKDVKNTKEELVPLFCLNTPTTKINRKRPTSCDVNFFNNDARSSNFSSTATQPSSGFRGSSTMLNSNNSNGTNSPRNATFGYKYDSSSDSNTSRRSGSGSFSHSKSYLTTFGNSNEVPPPRPPLPRSILRINSLDNQQYSCKTQKENANKRYSMIELGDRNLIKEEKSCTKRTAYNLNSRLPNQIFFDENEVQKHYSDDSDLVLNKQSRRNKSDHSKEKPSAVGKSALENDMRRLEELLEISAVFGESVDSFTESDMLRLRSQVSKFLTMQKNLERVSETLQVVNEVSINDTKDITYEENSLGSEKSLHTPHNTPEHKKQLKMALEKDLTRDLNNLFDIPVNNSSKTCGLNGPIHEKQDCLFQEENLGGMKKTVSFAENISFAVKQQELFDQDRKSLNSPNFMLPNQKHQVKPKRSVDLPICEESVEGISYDTSTRNLLQNSVELLHKKDLMEDVKNAVEKILKFSQEKEEDPANICLHHLCPSLYALLSDGLKDEINTPFGPIRNSVWSVIEASSQQGPMTQTLNELVQRLNRDDIFTEGLIKFNAFIFGLLNARALSGWFSYLRTRDSLLHKYYENSGLLLISNTAGAPIRTLIDQLVQILDSLCSINFNLDLMYQTKLLHCSLQNINCLLEDSGNNAFLTPTKQFMLLKLVQSIQNSISQGGEGRSSKHTMEDIEQKTSDPPLMHLLEKNRSICSRRGTNKTRPRSGCDTLGTGITDVASAMKKRWSGVHQNSKLVEAFDRLGNDSESDYTDSLDIAKPKQSIEKNSPTKNGLNKENNNSEGKTEKSKADLYTKEQKKNILFNLNKKNSEKVETCLNHSDESDVTDKSVSRLENSGYKFKRLQQKWEKLSNRSASDSDSDIKSPSLASTPMRKTKSTLSKNQTSEKSDCDSNITTPSPTSRISKIPRLVTSPLSSAPSTKQPGIVKKVISPISSTPGNFHQRGVKTGFNTLSKTNNCEKKVTTHTANRLSRIDDKSEVIPSPGKGQVTRPTSLPYRGCNTMPAKKTEANSKRASSMSLNRKPASKKLQHVPRTVRTLTHRLPLDSGHLSFNEGEKLKVVLEVDKTWLLCCRGNQKGLVPKSAVISDIEDNKF